MKLCTTYIMIFLLNFAAVKAQNLTSYISQESPITYPLGMINYNTFSHVLHLEINPDEWGNMGGVVLSQIDKNGNLLQKKWVPSNTGMVGSFYHNDALIKCLPAKNKGLFILLKVYYCHSSSGGGIANRYVLFDSTGNVLNSSNVYIGGYSDIGNLADSFYFVASDKQLNKINPTNAIITNTFFTANSTIKASTTIGSDKIVVKSNSHLYLIDTSGFVHKQKLVSEKYTTLIGHSDHIYAYSIDDKLIHKLDTNLNVVKTLTISPSIGLKDFRISNDTMLLTCYDNSIKRSVLQEIDTALYIATSKTIDIASHTVFSFNKLNKTYILSSEANAVYGFYKPTNSPTTNDLGFFQMNSLNNYNFNNDLILTGIKHISIDSVKNSNPYPYYKILYYTNEICIKNNSSNTINSFRLFDMNKNIQTNEGSSQCYNQKTPIGSIIYTLTIAPFDSIKILYKSSSWLTYDVPANTQTLGVKFCYYLSLPNNKFEKDILNSSVCQTLTVTMPTLSASQSTTAPTQIILSDASLFPNPAKQFINLPVFNVVPAAATMLHNKNVVIRDMLGQVVLETEARTNIDVSFLSSGVYFISYEFLGRIRDEKFIKLD